MYEIDEVELFFHEVAFRISEETVMKTYIAMGELAKAKYCERIVITTCKAYAPKRNYGISKAELRDFVGNVLDEMVKRYEGATG